VGGTVPPAESEAPRATFGILRKRRTTVPGDAVAGPIRLGIVIAKITCEQGLSTNPPGWFREHSPISRTSVRHKQPSTAMG